MHKIYFCPKVPMPWIIRWMTVLVWYLPESVSEEGLIQSSPFAERSLCTCVQLFIVDILCICLLWIALHCGRAMHLFIVDNIALHSIALYCIVGVHLFIVADCSFTRVAKFFPHTSHGRPSGFYQGTSVIAAAPPFNIHNFAVFYLHNFFVLWHTAVCLSLRQITWFWKWSAVCPEKSLINCDVFELIQSFWFNKKDQILLLMRALLPVMAW